MATPDAPKPPSMLPTAMRWLLIGWTCLSLLGLGGCVAFTFIHDAEQPQASSGMAAGGAVISLLVGSVIWFGLWALVAVPALVIWLVSRKK